MRLLLDTHILLRAAGGSAAADRSSPLSAEAVALIGAPDNQPMFSVVSLWEVAIKTSPGRPGFAVDPRLLRRGLLDNGYEELAILGEHALAVTGLPPLHGDPFDRLLVAQATVEGVLLLTADAAVARYPGPIRRV
jgi:PIN domain nuclease of toxin-antitoxin system